MADVTRAAFAEHRNGRQVTDLPAEERAAGAPSDVDAHGLSRTRDVTRGAPNVGASDAEECAAPVNARTEREEAYERALFDLT